MSLLLLGTVSLGRDGDREGRVGRGQAGELQRPCPCAYRPGTSPAGEPGAQGPCSPLLDTQHQLLEPSLLRSLCICAHAVPSSWKSGPFIRPTSSLPSCFTTQLTVAPPKSGQDTNELSCSTCFSTSTGLWKASGEVPVPPSGSQQASPVFRGCSRHFVVPTQGLGQDSGAHIFCAN